MDAMQIAILITIINVILDGIIVGIVVYVIQSKIDTAVQKSFLEYQTKFVATHERKVETLETLYKKLALYGDEFSKLLWGMSATVALRRRKGVSAADYQKAEKMLYDFWAFFVENRLFLPDDMAKKIQSIYSQLKFMHEVARAGFTRNEIDEDLQGNIPTHWDLSDYRSYTPYSQEEWDGFDYGDVMKIFLDDVTAKVQELQDLYKSVAELRDDKG